MPIRMEHSATRTARLAARTATNVAIASTSVPTAVARAMQPWTSRPSKKRIAGPLTVMGRGGSRRAFASLSSRRRGCSAGAAYVQATNR
jgi:hypothetical protein